MVGIFWITILFEVAGAISITTPGNDTRISLTPFGITAENRTFFIFKLKACGSAHIFLLDSETNPTKIKEFIFGNKANTKCEFADHTEIATYTKFSYACSNACNVFDEYWISWTDENSDGSQDWTMGYGSVLFNNSIGHSPLTGSTFNPSYIGISSSNQPAFWEFITQETTKSETTTQLPETTSQLAETTTQLPETATQLAETTSTRANVVTTEVVISTTPVLSTSTTSSSTISTSTQADQPSTSGPADNPFCYCSFNRTCDYSRNYTDEEIAQLIDAMIQELKVSVKDTNAYKRRLISAPDDRPSAQYVGSVGALVIGFVILGIVLMDLPRVVVFFRNDKTTENVRKMSKSRKKPQK